MSDERISVDRQEFDGMRSAIELQANTINMLQDALKEMQKQLAKQQLRRGPRVEHRRR